MEDIDFREVAVDDLSLIVQIALCMTFGASSILKAVGFRRFTDEVRAHRLLPSILLARLVAATVIALEALLAIALLVDAAAWWAAFGGLFLLACFGLVNVRARIEGIEGGCSCFGADSVESHTLAGMVRFALIAFGLLIVVSLEGGVSDVTVDLDRGLVGVLNASVCAFALVLLCRWIVSVARFASESQVQWNTVARDAAGRPDRGRPGGRV
ncbi:MAG: hypothetical protein F4Z28_03065 [Gammaproteobacteria bacterium]|nr:hypothetical protein [Gammaproteobacteria bacterium]